MDDAKRNHGNSPRPATGKADHIAIAHGQNKKKEEEEKKKKREGEKKNALLAQLV